MRHRYAVSLRFQYSSIWRDGEVWPCFGGTALIQCGAVMIGSDSIVSLNTPHGSPGSQLHCVIFVGSLFVHFVACRLGMAAGGPLWCCCPGAFGRGHASMARSGVGDHGLVGICGCPIRAALGWGTAVVVPVLAATTTCPVAWVRFHCCFIVIFFQICLSVLRVWNGYEHIHVHVDEILVWNWVSPGWLFP